MLQPLGIPDIQPRLTSNLVDRVYTTRESSHLDLHAFVHIPVVVYGGLLPIKSDKYHWMVEREDAKSTIWTVHVVELPLFGIYLCMILHFLRVVLACEITYSPRYHKYEGPSLCCSITTEFIETLH